MHTQEADFPEGHFLIVGTPFGKIIRGDSLEKVIKTANEIGTPIIANHPFFFDKSGIYLSENPEMLKYLSGIEVWNSQAIKGNKEAKEFYQRVSKDYDLGAISSTDVHYPFEIGLSHTNLEQINFEGGWEKTNENLCKIIKNHKSWDKETQKISYRGFFNHASWMVIRLSALRLGIDLD